MDWFIWLDFHYFYKQIKNKYIGFTLGPAHGRLGRGNLVLRPSVPHFLPNSGGIACWVAELNAALYLDTRAKKCNKYFISLSGDRTHNQSVLQ